MLEYTRLVKPPEHRNKTSYIVLAQNKMGIPSYYRNHINQMPMQYTYKNYGIFVLDNHCVLHQECSYHDNKTKIYLCGTMCLSPFRKMTISLKRCLPDDPDCSVILNEQ
jgi:hypothetical protein